MTEQQAAASTLLGFLVFEKTAKEDGFIGALMVTDNRGYPLEFRATTPVKPSLVQKTLYGGQLEHYVGVELCGQALLRESQRKPKIILVPDRALLDVGDNVDVDIVAIWRAGESLKVEDEAVSGSRGTIRPSDSGRQPMVYEAHFSNEAHQSESLTHIEQCAGRFDLVEAFERMRTALELLAKEDSRYA
jgi:hypothetical protein